MRYIFVLILSIPTLLSSCTQSPSKMAKEYCDCMAGLEQGKKNEGDCSSLAESHLLQLGEDEKALNDYSNKIMDCLGYRTIKTGK